MSPCQRPMAPTSVLCLPQQSEGSEVALAASPAPLARRCSSEHTSCTLQARGQTTHCPPAETICTPGCDSAHRCYKCDAAFHAQCIKRSAQHIQKQFVCDNCRPPTVKRSASCADGEHCRPTRLAPSAALPCISGSRSCVHPCLCLWNKASPRQELSVRRPPKRGGKCISKTCSLSYSALAVMQADVESFNCCHRHTSMARSARTRRTHAPCTSRP